MLEVLNLVPDRDLGGRASDRDPKTSCLSQNRKRVSGVEARGLCAFPRWASLIALALTCGFAAKPALAAPANDNFASAQTLSGTKGTVTGSNVGATTESGEPTNVDYQTLGTSVWYKYTPATTGILNVDTIGSTFNNTLAVYTGPTVAGLTQIAGDYNGTQTQLSVQVTKSTVYEIQVGGLGGATGSINLDWSQPANPANDNFVSAQTLSGTSGTVTGTNVGATTESGEPTNVDYQTTESTVWYKYTPTATGILNVDTIGSSFNNTLAVYTGSAVSGLTQIADNYNGTQTQLSVQVTKSVTYSIQVGGLNQGFGVGNQGSINLDWSQPSNPANDNFASAQTITGTSGTVTGTNVGATTESGEPTNVDYQTTESTVWYKYTPTATGILNLDTIGSSFNNTLAVYTGTAVSGLTQIADNYNGTQTQLSVQVTKSVTYSIQVGGLNQGFGVGNQGSINLDWSQPSNPSNDNFVSAQTLSGTSGTVTGTNVGATTESGEPTNVDYQTTESTVWYKYTPTATGILNLDTIGSSFNNTLAVYTGTAVSGLTQIADNYNGTQTQLSVQVTKSVTYSIQVGGLNQGFGVGNQGSINLDWSQPANPANDNFASAQTITGTSGTVTGTNVGATTESSEPTNVDYQTTESTVWYRYTPTATGILNLDTIGSSFNNTLAVYTGSAVSGLTQIADNYNGTQTQLSVQVTKSVTYSIQVGGLNQGFGVGNQGSVNLDWSQPSNPANDNFVSAQTLSGTGGTVTGTNVGATTESGEPTNVDYQTAESTVWYRYTPTATGILNLDTIGSSFNNTLAVYTGSTVSGLTQVAGNYNGTQTQLSLQVTKAVSYSIQVGGLNQGFGVGSQGSINLDWSQPANPANDNFASALTITGSNGTLTGSNTGATTESGEPTGVDYQTGESTVWYRYTPTASGTLNLDTIGSSFDNTLAVYTGSAVSGLTQVAGDYNGTQTQLSLTVTQGVVYSIQIGGVNQGFGVGAQGRFQLDWAGPGAASYSVSGRVTQLNSNGFAVGLQGVSVLRTGSSTPAVTDLDGSYYFTGLPNSTYTLTPSLSGFTFSPTSIAAVVSGVQSTNNDFQATPVVTGPATVSISPTSSESNSSAAMTFTSIYSDGLGASDLKNLRLIVNSSASGTGGMYFIYSRASNVLYMMKDDGVTLQGGVAPGSNNYIENSQGILNCAGTTVTTSGNTITVNWSVIPFGQFAGAHNLYMECDNPSGAVAGFNLMGTWTVNLTTGNNLPEVQSINPVSAASQSSTALTLSLTVADPNTVNNISQERILINGSLNAANALYGLYDNVANKLYLFNDAGTAVTGGITPGTNTVITNSQGSLNCAATHVTVSGNSLVISWNFTPSSAFTGAKNVYLLVSDNESLSDGWRPLATWQINAATGAFNDGTGSGGLPGGKGPSSHSD